MTPETSQNEHRPSMLPPFVAATIRGWKGRQAAVLLIAARCVLDSPVCFADTRPFRIGLRISPPHAVRHDAEVQQRLASRRTIGLAEWRESSTASALIQNGGERARITRRCSCPPARRTLTSTNFLYPICCVLNCRQAAAVSWRSNLTSAAFARSPGSSENAVNRSSRSRFNLITDRYERRS